MQVNGAMAEFIVLWGSYWCCGRYIGHECYERGIAVELLSTTNISLRVVLSHGEPKSRERKKGNAIDDK